MNDVDKTTLSELRELSRKKEQKIDIEGTLKHNIYSIVFPMPFADIDCCESLMSQKGIDQFVKELRMSKELMISKGVKFHCNSLTYKYWYDKNEDFEFDDDWADDHLINIKIVK